MSANSSTPVTSSPLVTSSPPVATTPAVASTPSTIILSANSFSIENSTPIGSTPGSNTPTAPAPITQAPVPPAHLSGPPSLASEAPTVFGAQNVLVTSETLRNRLKGTLESLTPGQVLYIADPFIQEINEVLGGTNLKLVSVDVIKTRSGNNVIPYISLLGSPVLKTRLMSNAKSLAFSGGIPGLRAMPWSATLHISQRYHATYQPREVVDDEPVATIGGLTQKMHAATASGSGPGSSVGTNAAASGSGSGRKREISKETSLKVISRKSAKQPRTADESAFTKNEKKKWIKNKEKEARQCLESEAIFLRKAAEQRKRHVTAQEEIAVLRAELEE